MCPECVICLEEPSDRNYFQHLSRVGHTVGITVGVTVRLLVLGLFCMTEVGVVIVLVEVAPLG